MAGRKVRTQKEDDSELLLFCCIVFFSGLIL